MIKHLENLWDTNTFRRGNRYRVAILQGFTPVQAECLAITDWNALTKAEKEILSEREQLENASQS